MSLAYYPGFPNAPILHTKEHTATFKKVVEAGESPFSFVELRQRLMTRIPDPSSFAEVVYVHPTRWVRTWCNARGP